MINKKSKLYFKTGTDSAVLSQTEARGKKKDVCVHVCVCVCTCVHVCVYMCVLSGIFSTTNFFPEP